MATDILSIPQIPNQDASTLQNDMHIGQGADISRRLQNARWTDSTHETKVFPDNVDALMADFIAAQAAEDEVYVLSQASEFTKQRLEKDAQRDALYKEIKRTVDTFATLTIFPDKQAAALVMQPLMQKYNIQPDGGIEAQTVATDQWLQEQDMSAQADAASMTLGIRESLRQLKTLNDEIQHLTAIRNDERAQRSTAELKTARTATDRAFATQRLCRQSIDYVVQPAGKENINVYFGRRECLDAIRLFVTRPLNELSPEEDFILGAMLGYDICAQCERYCERKTAHKQRHCKLA